VRAAVVGGRLWAGGVRGVLKGLVWLPFYRARAPGARRLDVVLSVTFVVFGITAEKNTGLTQAHSRSVQCTVVEAESWGFLLV